MKISNKILSRVFRPLLLIAATAVLLTRCGTNLIPNTGDSSTPPVAERVGNAYVPGDEVPLVYNSVTGAFEPRPIPGVSVVKPAPQMITYTGVSN